MSKYDFDLDMNSNNSLANILKNIKPNSTVLEFGPAHGRMTKYLKEALSCDITIVEIDREAASEASKYTKLSFVGKDYGDIASLKWYEYLKSNNIKFDYIIFADVLEHIYNPLNALTLSKDLLNDNGLIWISIPNVSHNSVIIDLINDKFEYRDVGILDNTHVRFFTDGSLRTFVDKAGLEIVGEYNTTCNVEDSEFNNSYDDIVGPKNLGVRNFLRARAFGSTYQFVWGLKQKGKELI